MTFLTVILFTLGIFLTAPLAIPPAVASYPPLPAAPSLAAASAENAAISASSQGVGKEAESNLSESEFQGESFKQDDLTLKNYRGKVVVLHFWATWCPPCLEELPALARFMTQHYPNLKTRGLVLLTINNDLREKDLNKFLNQHEISAPIYWDARGKLNAQLHLIGVPHTVILGRDGQILAKLRGRQNWESEQFMRFLEEFL